MKDQSIEKKSLIEELNSMRKRVTMLEEREAEFRFFAENMGDVAFTVDMELQTTYVSPSIERVLGYTAEERVIQKSEEQLTPKSQKLVLETLAAELELEKMEGSDKNRLVTLELEYYHKDGSVKCLETYVRGMRDSDGNLTGFYGLSRDITERKQIEEALRESEIKYRELSIIDDLTQLYNSRYFYQQLKMEIERANRYKQPITLLLLDIDNFKAFNDTYGHIEGDHVLFRLGQVVKRCLRQADSAYRYGGEEFTVLLPMTKSVDGTVTAERIRTEFKKAIFIPESGKKVHLTLSIGLAQYNLQENMKTFVHRVDQLMYRGKKNGKDKVCSET